MSQKAQNEPAQNEPAPNFDFDILELLADMDTDDNELVMAATQVEALYQDEKQKNPPQ